MGDVLRLRALALGFGLVGSYPAFDSKTRLSGHDPIAVIAHYEICYSFLTMNSTAEKVASDWIAYARLGAENAPDQVFADGWVLVDLCWDNPALAWEAIKNVIRHYKEDAFYADYPSEAQSVGGLLAAGPLEDLLSEHGSGFISAIEAEAQNDRRMRWALGGVWQSTTPDDIWARVQRLADYSFWERQATK